ncbi:FkbM family methyltransferase [Geomonas terrae]|uniref:FkbM family methyltransferase n=1 Tax=Geomonas terrae TaxID=2562681 RepID=A0A4V6R3M4_9BACT|nr:FkbM family methyltransferase [Geomonas terrae]TGU72282.1 FkbM family methyltransferase [Geomonas terrae]
MRDLLDYKKDVFTQNGEDGIIEAILGAVGTPSRTCCEFGAWDGIHFSNCRRLILDGWRALMIEGDAGRYQDLVRNYQGNDSVFCVNRFVDTGVNSLGSILKEYGIEELDFLSIDIDGYDYDVLKTLDVRPRVICIEVNAGHSPESDTLIDREIAKDNVGQPMPLFVLLAAEMGYQLVCYSGNAFLVRDDLMAGSSLTTLTSVEAYAGFIDHLPVAAREWLYLVNLGLVPPYYRYGNPYLAHDRLGIGASRAFKLKSRAALRNMVRQVRNIAGR